DDAIDLLAQRGRIELGLQAHDAPERTPEHFGGEIEIETQNVRGGVAERERAGNDRAGRGAADEIEPVAEMDLLLAEALAQHALDLLQESHRDSAPHAATVEREQALRARIKQMAVAFAFERRGHKPVLTIAIVLLRIFWAGDGCAIVWTTPWHEPRVSAKATDRTCGHCGYADLMASFFTRDRQARDHDAALWSRRPYDGKKAARSRHVPPWRREEGWSIEGRPRRSRMPAGRGCVSFIPRWKLWSVAHAGGGHALALCFLSGAA